MCSRVKTYGIGYLEGSDIHAAFLPARNNIVARIQAGVVGVAGVQAKTGNRLLWPP